MRSRRGRARGGRLATTFFLLMILVGTSLVGGSVYVISVQVPDATRLPERTTLYYSDGTTVLARLGTQNRTILAGDAILDSIKKASVAAADPGFWASRSSPITRSLVRYLAGLEGTSYPTRLQATVLAWRFADTHSKEEILTEYLNAVAFGRGAYGVEAAARAYFGKSADTRANPATQLTVAEAVLLASMAELPGQEPSQQRWAEVRDAMVELGSLTDAEAQALAYPEPIPVEPEPDADRPTGLIVNHVLSELVTTASFPDKTWAAISNGGYAIVTTVDSTAQSLLEKTADETVTGSVMHGQPANLQAAAVAVEPGTGRVLAYYGGHSGTGADFAGWYVDEDGDPAGYGAHPPGETFHAYVLAAALKAGISVRSRWDARSPKEFSPDRVGVNAVRNDGACPTGTTCTLADATLAALNTPYYALTEKIGAENVVEAAATVGIADMWADGHSRVALAAGHAGDVVPSRFGNAVGLGQYPVTVLDQAAAMATFAAAGRRSPAHFVREVRRGGEVVYAETLPPLSAPTWLNSAQAADLTWALSRVGAGKLVGRVAASKTGSWELAGDPTQSAHAWIIGYTGNLALAVWVGNKAEEKPLVDRSGVPISGSGLPATLFRTYLTGVHSALNLRVISFPNPVYTGDEKAGNAS